MLEATFCLNVPITRRLECGTLTFRTVTSVYALKRWNPYAPPTDDSQALFSEKIGFPVDNSVDENLVDKKRAATKRLFLAVLYSE